MVPHSTEIGPKEDFQLHKVIWGKKVRYFFARDLKCISPGVCFLPEWICHSMTLVALESHHRVLFYPVRKRKGASIPLEADWTQLVGLIRREKKKGEKIILLTAFPFGYIDRQICLLYHHFKTNQQEAFYHFLDLSQAYGAYDFRKDLLFCDAVYLSFNGRKLIDTGGAVRIHLDRSNQSFKKVDHSLILLKKSISKALLWQKSRWQKLLAELVFSFGEKYSEIENLLPFFEGPKTRSSYHRTALSLPQKSPLFQILINERFGQTIHPNPQFGIKKPSLAYLDWLENTLLLFPNQR